MAAFLDASKAGSCIQMLRWQDAILLYIVRMRSARCTKAFKFLLPSFLISLFSNGRWKHRPGFLCALIFPIKYYIREVHVSWTSFEMRLERSSVEETFEVEVIALIMNVVLLPFSKRHNSGPVYDSWLSKKIRRIPWGQALAQA
jgi:hypothetical protein